MQRNAPKGIATLHKKKFKAGAFQPRPDYNRLAGLQLTSRQPCWWTRTKRFPPLGTELFYHANSAKKKFFIVLSLTWPPCHVVASQELKMIKFSKKKRKLDLSEKNLLFKYVLSSSLSNIINSNVFFFPAFREHLLKEESRF